MIVKLTGAILSFPNVFAPKGFADKPDEKNYSASFILDKVKDAKQIADFRAACKQILTDTYGAKVPPGFKLCLYDGIEKEEVDGYGAGVNFINSSRKEDKGAPVVVDYDLTPLLAKDKKIYGGCIVNANVRLWVQDNNFGKRVNADLRSIQRVGKGTPFSDGDAPIDASSEFDVVEPDPSILGDESGDDDGAGLL